MAVSRAKQSMDCTFLNLITRLLKEVLHLLSASTKCVLPGSSKHHQLLIIHPLKHFPTNWSPTEMRNFPTRTLAKPNLASPFLTVSLSMPELKWDTHSWKVGTLLLHFLSKGAWYTVHSTVAILFPQSTHPALDKLHWDSCLWPWMCFSFTMWPGP